jgi:hypothetical protein
MSLNYTYLDVNCERVICLNSDAHNYYITSFFLRFTSHYIQFELERLRQQNSEEAAAPSVWCKMNKPVTTTAFSAIYSYSPLPLLAQVTPWATPALNSKIARRPRVIFSNIG